MAVIFYFRQVYSSLSFVIPVITFTLVYNIPKFLELVTVTRNVSDTGNNNNFENCVETIFYGTNSSNSYTEKERISRMFPNQRMNDSLSNKTSLSKEKLFLIGEELSKQILEQCCNCTNSNFIHRQGTMKCESSAISRLISALIKFLSNNSWQKEEFVSFHAVLHVRWNMRIILIPRQVKIKTNSLTFYFKHKSQSLEN